MNIFWSKWPNRWFRYTLLVPTVAWVHFLNLKPLACILISTGSTWDIGTKYWYALPQEFEYQIGTLTIPTSSTINTVTKVEERIKPWCDFLANKNPETQDNPFLQLFNNRNLGLASADPLRISPELR
jgi:hypothetical protein